VAHILVDRVKETTTTTGTGTVALAGAVTGFRAFSAVMANNDTTLYAIVAQTPGQWEVGLGTWLTGNSLARTTPIAGSAATPVNFSAGTKDVFQTFTPTGRIPGMTFTGPLTPATNDAAALGSGSLMWSDIFLASGGNVDFNNGDVQIQHQNPDVLNIFGGRLIVAAGTTTYPPLQFIAATNMTTPAVGAVEMDATNFYGTTDSGNRGYIPVRHFIRADAVRTYTSNTSAQTIFNSPTNGRLTLETGTYRVAGVLQWTAMSSTVGNRNIDLLGAGTATVAAWLWHVVGVDGAAGSATTQTGSTMTTSTTPASAVGGTSGTAMTASLQGTFEVTVAGTLIPTTTMVTAAASILSVGSYLEIWRIGTTSVVSVGQWD